MVDFKLLVERAFLMSSTRESGVGLICTKMNWNMSNIANLLSTWNATPSAWILITTSVLCLQELVSIVWGQPGQTNKLSLLFHSRPFRSFRFDTSSRPTKHRERRIYARRFNRRWHTRLGWKWAGHYTASSDTHTRNSWCFLCSYVNTAGIW